MFKTLKNRIVLMCKPIEKPLSKLAPPKELEVLIIQVQLQVSLD